MKGRIKMFNEEKGFGFILGDDQNDYFFHISNVNTFEKLNRGDYVEYDAEKGQKGWIAKKVKVTKTIKSTTNQSFISLGNTRIKTSNIKNYGISQKKKYYVKVYEFDEFRLLSSSYDWFGKLEEWDEETVMRCREFNSKWPKGRVRRLLSANGEIVDAQNKTMTSDDLIEKDVHYLYITTYQKDNFTFLEDETSFDIYEKLKEIDNCMI